MRNPLPRRLLPALAAPFLPVQAEGQPAPPLTPSLVTPRERALHRRAVEAVIWGMPAVNFELMAQAMRGAGAAFNQVVYWSRPLSWKNQTLTPNPDTIYLMPFYDTKDAGPVVLEIPPAEEGSSITGSIDDGWQTALEDVGPAGADKGAGGKYLILPPDHQGATPEGMIALPSGTHAGFALLRSNLRGHSDADLGRAVAYGQRVRVYPVAQAASPPPTRFVDAAEVLFDSTIPYDARFFRALDRFVQREPWIERDRAMVDPLRSLGIEKGRAFNPDARTEEILATGAREAHAFLDAGYEALFSPPYFEGTQWALPVRPNLLRGLQSNFADRNSYPADERGILYAMGYFSAKRLGEGQFYLVALRDKAGQPLDGGGIYRLTVPARAPVRLYWSVTAYDRATHALIRGLDWSSRASNTPALRANADGSTDIFFGPTAPEGWRDNWVPTRTGSGFELMFRFYGPERPLFDKTWRLPDIERMGL
ncbi:DUF1254 domain-containing protein [Paracraurococcus lichenis]|uniref:DUF1254 domain-containing protein n=1 Tax=Paracraurococcus lichenis TaxID=3064888 RepID=A0ABT9ED05_9PROT|nr:DUF1254 domain-containing protein [Paracraurococcus sp. LOR1-02]MDO9714091.1 DUF1254 domain-containing protein [Paracraurococcus sp. LOR1-02]